MNILTNKAVAVCNRLEMFQSQPTDYTLVMNKLPELVALIEEVESFSVSCRKVIAGYQKELPFYTGLIDKSNGKESKNILSEVKKHVTVSLENDILTLTLFPLIKNLSSRTKEYISLLIGEEIKRYFSDHAKPDFANNDCVIVINSKYTKPELVRDNDSVEISTIINSLKIYFLTDDDGIHLSVYRTGVISDRHETEIYLMKQSDFVLWLFSTVGAQIPKEEQA